MTVIRTRLSFRLSSLYSIVLYQIIVAAVSIYDMLLTIAYAPSLHMMEQNPIGRWLMKLDRLNPTFGGTPDLTLFLSMKIIGTVIVLIAMFVLVQWRSRIGHLVSMGVSSFQLCLAFYLTFATND